MEFSDLNYFTEIARTENLHRSAERLGLSPAALSKAISRLESELEVKLFDRIGRNIRLSRDGHYLLGKAQELLNLHDEVASHFGAAVEVQLTVAGLDTHLSAFAAEITQGIQADFPEARFHYAAVADSATRKWVASGRAQLGLVTAAPDGDFLSRVIHVAKFRIYVGRGNKLFRVARADKELRVDEVLRLPFCVLESPLLGSVGSIGSTDGWDDHKWPRTKPFVSATLKTVEAIVESGLALAYLPDYIGAKIDALPLRVKGVSELSQSIMIISKKRPSPWMGALFDPRRSL